MARCRLFGPLLVLAEQLAAKEPLVLVIEDVHWADRSTGELLAFLVRNLRQAAVLAVVTFRSDEPGQAGSVRRLLAELGRMDTVTRLDLERLSRGQVAGRPGHLGRQDPRAPAGPGRGAAHRVRSVPSAPLNCDDGRQFSQQANR